MLSALQKDHNFGTAFTATNYSFCLYGKSKKNWDSYLQFIVSVSFIADVKIDLADSSETQCGELCVSHGCSRHKIERHYGTICLTKHCKLCCARG